MSTGTIGLITYQAPHLKTEQVFHRIVDRGLDLRFYAIPFAPRKARSPLLDHRPDQASAASPRELALRHGIPYKACASDLEIDGSCDLYLVLGAGILSAGCVAGKRILNAHPGIIPAVRGLDAFKWAVLEGRPLGNTLHFIDAGVDAGEIVSVVATPVYASDTPATLARRHYEAEVDCLCAFQEHLSAPRNPFADIATGEPHMRMPLEREKEMLDRFETYRDRFASLDESSGGKVSSSRS